MTQAQGENCANPKLYVPFLNGLFVLTSQKSRVQYLFQKHEHMQYHFSATSVTKFQYILVDLITTSIVNQGLDRPFHLMLKHHIIVAHETKQTTFSNL
jgi:hypothetical protein